MANNTSTVRQRERYQALLNTLMTATTVIPFPAHRSSKKQPLIVQELRVAVDWVHILTGQTPLTKFNTQKQTRLQALDLPLTGGAGGAGALTIGRWKNSSGVPLARMAFKSYGRRRSRNTLRHACAGFGASGHVWVCSQARENGEGTTS